MTVTVIGCGYVGFTWAVYLSEHHTVRVWDIDLNKLNLIRKGKTPFADSELSARLQSGKLSLVVLEKQEDIYKESDIYIVAVPSNYSEKINGLNTTIVEKVVLDIVEENPAFKAIIIKSTVPIGFTNSLRNKCCSNRIYYMPEFLREGRAYTDCSKPSRVIIGGADVKSFHNIECIFTRNKLDAVYMSLEEAEATKLFSNSYLAMRVAFFNEVDSFAENQGLNSENIIKGICADNRIGSFYNNPSFGYGGYCLPKDTKQLLKSLDGKDDILISAVINQNEERQNHIVDLLIKKNVNVFGIYRLLTKNNSDNIRNSAMIGIIMKLLCRTDKNIVIYEPLLSNGLIFKEYINRVKLVNSVNKLAEYSDIILANRKNKELDPFMDKVYTRDIYTRD